MCMVAQEFTFERAFYFATNTQVKISGSVIVNSEDQTFTINTDGYPESKFENVRISGDPDTQLEVRTSMGDYKFRLQIYPNTGGGKLEKKYPYVLNYTMMDTFTEEKTQILYYLAKTK